MSRGEDADAGTGRSGREEEGLGRTGRAGAQASGVEISAMAVAPSLRRGVSCKAGEVGGAASSPIPATGSWKAGKAGRGELIGAAAGVLDARSLGERSEDGRCRCNGCSRCCAGWKRRFAIGTCSEDVQRRGCVTRRACVPQWQRGFKVVIEPQVPDLRGGA